MADQMPAVEPADAAEKLRRLTLLVGRGQQLMLEQWAREADKGSPYGQAITLTLMDEWSTAMRAFAAEPERIAEVQARYWSQTFELWNSFLTGDPSSPVEAEADRDRRFKSDAWAKAPVFDFIRQAYLLSAHAITDMVGGIAGLDRDTRDRMMFHTRQFIDAMSPSNFAALNPDVLKAAVESDGESLLKGLEHMLADLSAGRMHMVDEKAFEVGRNIAATPGKVVYENRLMQLIQYTPTTESVFATPLLIFPPWINKFYILDLTAEKSFIRYAVAAGLTVFVVSWRNPGPELAGIMLDNYVEEGFLEALDRVLKVTGEPAVHTIGYCVAGTTLAATLALLAARGEADRVASATFFTAQVDFENAGELRAFIEDKQLEAIEKITSQTGFLDGRYMAGTFSMLRANELIWNYVVNNYLMGKDYLPFDLLYWNSDSSNVPASWHIAYLKDFYRDNKLVRPGGVSILGTPVDLGRVRTPVYIQAGREDHIAPAKSVFRMTGQLGGEMRFVLAGSGHVAGVVNPPSSGKYQHWVVDGPVPPTLDEFVAAAREVKGSWWPDWTAWISARSGAMVPARQPGPGIEDAPGRYVTEKVG